MKKYLQRSALAVVVMFLLTGCSSARADEVYTFVVKKQEAKSQNRWSLSEWLETRDRMRLMDLWLALHSPTPYEFFLGTDYSWNQWSGTGSDQTQGSVRVMGAAYASIFGLEFERSFSPVSEWVGTFDFRFFGYHVQSTHMTFQLGLRSQDSSGTSVRNAFLGLESSIYFGKFFGLHALYRNYLTSPPNLTGGDFYGWRGELGGFVDFNFVQVYGTFFREQQVELVGGASYGTQRSGPLLGLKLFF